MKDLPVHLSRGSRTDADLRKMGGRDRGLFSFFFFFFFLFSFRWCHCIFANYCYIDITSYKNLGDRGLYNPYLILSAFAILPSLYSLPSKVTYLALLYGRNSYPPLIHRVTVSIA